MSGSSKTDARPRARHLSDYLALVRRRRALAAALFLLVCGGLAARALFSEPVYRAAGMLQIDTKQSSGGLLGELAALESPGSTEAELEIMRSRLVALGAARGLEAQDFLSEEHALRPFELLLARFRNKSPDCRLRIRCAKPGEDAPTCTFRFVFGGGRGLPTLDVTREDERTGVRESLSLGGVNSPARFTAFGCEFQLDWQGDPSGSTYRLPLRSDSEWARWIQRRVRAEEVGLRTGVVNLGFEADTPRLAERAANELARSYLALKTEQKRAQALKASAFLGEATTEVHGRLSAAEEELDRFRAESGAVLLSERSQWLVQQSSALALERAELSVRLRDQEALVDAAATAQAPTLLLAGLGGEGVDAVTAGLAARATLLEGELRALREAGLKSAHPECRALEGELILLRGELRAVVEESLRGGAARLRSRLEHLDRTLEEFSAEERDLPQMERRLTVLTREVAANLRVHQFLVEKEQEARIALVSTLASVRRIDEALEPLDRLSPDLFRTLLVGVLLGLLAALAGVLFGDYLDRTLKSPQALEEGTGLTLYGAIPGFRSVRRGARRGTLIVAEQPHGVLAEAYRTLRTNLRFASLDRPVQTLAITSSVMGEGKTLTTGNLAAAYAQQGERVLLVDADLRRPSTHLLFGGRPSPGLTEVLEGRIAWSEAVRVGSVPGLALLHAGAKVSNPAALLDNERMHTLIGEWRAAYDVVLFDVPPILAVSDAAGFFRALDGVLLLARDKTCTLDVVLEARDQIRRVGANLLGVIFNGFDIRQGTRGSYGYYYGGYGYENRADETEGTNGNGSPGRKRGKQSSLLTGQDR